MRIYRNTKTDYTDYTKRLKEWGDKYGMRYVKREFEEKRQLFPPDTKKENENHPQTLFVHQ